MKRLKPAADPLPRKFAPGDPVKPTAEAIEFGWTNPGKVTSCGEFTVSVKVPGEDIVGTYPQDFWEPE